MPISPVKCQKNLKDNHNFSSVYVEKDRRAVERREWVRFRRVYREERAKPDNQWRKVILAYKNRCVIVDDAVVDTFNPSVLVEMGQGTN